MDAPRTRYQVIEKDGRLIVIDSASGTPVTPQIAPPPMRAGQSMLPSVIEAGPRSFDGLAAALARLAIRARTPQGEAIVDWKWTVNHREQRWRARLDRDQEQRLGRALACFLPIPILFLGAFMGFGTTMTTLSLLLLAPGTILFLLGARTIARLRAETADRSVGLGG